MPHDTSRRRATGR